METEFLIVESYKFKKILERLDVLEQKLEKIKEEINESKSKKLAQNTLSSKEINEIIFFNNFEYCY
jgi:ABC-type uncharacterized transport system fused permease/ATPase subunit